VVVAAMVTPPFFLEDNSIGETSGEERTSLLVAKFSRTGELLWMRRSLGEGRAEPRKISIDVHDNIAVMGWVAGTEKFGELTSSGVDIRHTRPLIWKLDATGETLWVQNYGNVSRTAPYSQALDGAFDSRGDLVVSGQIATPEAPENTDLFLAKYSPAGQLMWERSATNSLGLTVAVTSTDTIYLATNFYSTLRFAETNVTTSAWQQAFVAQFSSEGKLNWLKLVKAPGKDPATHALTAGPDGSAILVGSYTKPDGNGAELIQQFGPDGSLLRNLANPPWSFLGYFDVDLRPDNHLLLVTSRELFDVSFSEPLRLKSRMEGNQLVLSWSAGFASAVLQSTDSINSTNWQSAGLSATLQNGEYVVRLNASEAQRFYRLVKPGNPS
jgi:hypothetical protein